MKARNVFREVEVLRMPDSAKASCDLLSMETAESELWNPSRGNTLVVKFEDYRNLLNAHASMVAIADIRNEEIERLRKRIFELGG